MEKFNDYWFNSSDGLELYARDYQHNEPIATILCIPGLTRNCVDFNFLCEQLNQRYRVLAMDLRGRGKSQFDPKPENYHPGVYCNDVITLLDSLQLDSVILIGTSLGGLVSMLLATMQPQRVTAVILNDIGPEASKDGIDRILAYVSNPAPVRSWAEATARTRDYLGRDYPDFSDQDWLGLTQKIYRENTEGQPALNFDPNIAELLKQNQNNAMPPDLWPMFSAIKELPLLLIRGELSNILSRQCAEKMQRINTGMRFIEVPNRGHAPLLTETECIQAINSFLNHLDGSDH